ncbi:MAG TPA: nucleotidyl transferase AbiEii/AbiGii toxin family protein [Gemmatimonadales bacterium]
MLLEGLTRGLESRRIPFMLIGGQAVLLHGQPRFTDDIDATLGVGPDQLSTVLEACSATGLEPLPPDLPAFVAETFVLPTRHAPSGLRVDLIFSTLPYEADAIRRAIRVRIGATDVPFATAEDLLIHKLFAGRPRDLEDAVGVIRRQGDALDWAYVTRWISAFAEVPGRERLSGMLEELRRTAEE